jgi:MarR family transcriptional regulator, 2-MHQ and catechol-resistance regulon repressor
MPRYPKRIQTASEEVSGVHLWLVLWKAYDAVRAYAIKDIASLGIGLSDFAILERLLHKGPSPVNDIGAQVSLTSGSMTIAIDRLGARGLVERRSLAEDRRTRVVHLTAKGRKLIGCAFAAHSASMNKLGENLTPAERAHAVRLLKKLGRAAESLPEE